MAAPEDFAGTGLSKVCDVAGHLSRSRVGQQLPGAPTRPSGVSQSLTDCLVEGDSAASDFGQDGFCGGGPDEGFGFDVVDLHVFLDGRDQVGNAVEHTSA